MRPHSTPSHPSAWSTDKALALSLLPNAHEIRTKIPSRPCTKDITEDEVSSKEVSYYGRFPQSVLDAAFEFLKLKLEDADVQSMLKTAGRGYKQYLKSRQGASAESCGRIKEMEKECVHPFLFPFVSGDGKAEASLIEYQEMLKTFRPNRTILEGDAARRKEQARTGGASSAAPNYMEVKRRHHDKYIEKTKSMNQKDSGAGAEKDSESECEAEEERGREEETAKAPSVAEILDAEAGLDSADANKYNFHSDFRDTSVFIANQPPNKRSQAGYSNSNQFAGSTFEDVVMDMTAGEWTLLLRMTLF